MNATAIRGAADTAKEELEAIGYTVNEIGNSTLGDTINTIIYAKDVEKAGQFKAYYPDATIKQNADMTYDIQIILGNDIQ